MRGRSNPEVVLARALCMFGDGNYWTQTPDESLGEVCAVTAIDSASRARKRAKQFLRDALLIQCQDDVASLNVALIAWNDFPGRTYPEVRNAFIAAMRLAMESRQKP